MLIALASFLFGAVPQIVSWMRDWRSDPQPVELSSPSVQIATTKSGTFALSRVEVENHSGEAIYMETVGMDALERRVPRVPLCPDGDHRNGTIPPHDSAIYTSMIKIPEPFDRRFRKPARVEFTASLRVGDPTDIKATTSYLAEFPGIEASESCGGKPWPRPATR